MSDKGTVTAVCLHEGEGAKARPVDEIELNRDQGVIGDSHSGGWRSQVALLSMESMEKAEHGNREMEPGANGENITTRDIDLSSLQPGDRLRVGPALVQVVEISDDTFSEDVIQELGDSLLPQHGVFARVIEGGTVTKGDAIETLS
jgi:MOSC domain-containing protein YiiM